MKVFVLIQQRPLRVSTYTSLTALYMANSACLGVSKSTLDKHDFDRFQYVSSRYIIAKTETLSAGDVRRIVSEEYKNAANASEITGKWVASTPDTHSCCGLSHQTHKRNKTPQK